MRSFITTPIIILFFFIRLYSPLVAALASLSVY
jgi:hypothetical protein